MKLRGGLLDGETEFVIVDGVRFGVESIISHDV